ncbi:hypothetical protein [Fluoribacter gormanii]|uniref:hypothetical protein n=1 Tax=Fluoribacter gormanii TaxID=464 RepID=UPI0010411618|nr:hypothetical protein [Fluoribacter gormanii]
MMKSRLIILFYFLIAPTLALAKLPAVTLGAPISLASIEAELFWCRKTDNRECNISKSKCEAFGECFSRPSAWCFQAQTIGELEDQMICVAHKPDCEDWWKQRSDTTSKCLERHPDEYPISQTKWSWK